MYDYTRNLMDCLIANLKPCALKGLGWPRSVQAGAKINVSAVLNCNKEHFYSWTANTSTVHGLITQILLYRSNALLHVTPFMESIYKVQ